jgi:osmotically inducible protein OsmC
LEKDGHPPALISTTAAVTMEKAAEGMRVTRMKVATRGAAPGVDQAGFAAAAEAARDTCPMSHLFKGIQVDLEARVES